MTGAGGSAGSSGAGAEGGSGGTGGTGGTGGSLCPDVPAHGPVAEECGIWVSASLGDDSNPGTQSAPMKSLTHAIEVAADGLGRVYACAETWNEPLVIPGHVSLFGGFDCAKGWAYVSEPKLAGLGRSVLQTPPEQISIKYIDAGKGNKAWLTDFQVEAADATVPGGSPIALLVRDNISLTLDHCWIISADGAPGQDGESLDAMHAPSEDGLGGFGEGACFSGDVSQGGVAPVTMCPDGTMSIGGKGGDSTEGIAEDGDPGMPGGAAGGHGQTANSLCTVGKDGQDGTDGMNGLGGTQRGRLTEDGYLGNPGQDGRPGTMGYGGGGGGANAGSIAKCNGMASGGPAGGSGGAGGCGGQGAKGGQAGGSSIVVAIRGPNAFVQLNSTLLSTGDAGRGGNGGAPQPGGYRGYPGQGGAGFNTPDLTGCYGGFGGKGGDGGWGGGGCGGSAVCVAHVGQKTWAMDAASDCTGGGNNEGGDGAPGDKGGEGQFGNLAHDMEMDPG